ncbi:MAG TPA: hypothetical protein VE825_16730 [Terriglobales bacterium]|jgi:hypothetical protein|nr:hypothetical protein [Terriglobales bacterium]
MKRLLAVLLFLPVLLFPQNPPAQDILLLHNGDLVLVDFTHSASGHLQFYSLSPRSRVDLSFSREQIEPLAFTHEQGWTTYRGNLDGTQVQVVLRESGGPDAGEIPGDSDLVVRVINGRVRVQLHADTDQRGKSCDRCNGQLQW